MARIKIAVASNSGGLEDMVADRFGRAPTFTVVEVDGNTGEILGVEVVENPGYRAASGAGVRAAETVAATGAKIYAGPQPGPNAYLALQHLGVKVVVVMGVRVKDAVIRALEEAKG